ncbi:Cellulose binding domain-containing protein [Anaeromicropila populeti]|uniref:Cellulose binding domain-containing protein n=1 Tax=Anaeromicropila populeti TaxID=37658 RepID=A0A1I6L051_9FIRM|nr:Cellulose binding domain-containing protein [Anaeromicropila populeti]
MVTPTPSASTGGSLPSGITCEYKVVSDWGSSFQGQIVLKNNSTKTYNGWTLQFNYNSKITSLWGAQLSGQSGTKVTVKNPSWDATLAPGSSVTIYFIATLGSDKNTPVNYSFS